jgi:predicted N-formylglutamate amidohydrolase
MPASDAGPASGLPYRAVNGDFNRGLIIICDHASNAIPPELDSLGLTPAELAQHIAWDIGAARIAAILAAQFAVPAVLCGVSRLVIDCNRHPGDPASIPDQVDGIRIPGNVHLTARQKAERLARWFRPYHEAVERMTLGAVAAAGDPVLLSVHSMTPERNGAVRPWPIALSSHEDHRLSTPMLAALRKRVALPVGDNEPYALDPAEDYSVPVHAMKRGLRHLQVEFRQDLVADDAGVAEWAGTFAAALKEVLPL